MRRSPLEPPVSRRGGPPPGTAEGAAGSCRFLSAVSRVISCSTLADVTAPLSDAAAPAELPPPGRPAAPATPLPMPAPAPSIVHCTSAAGLCTERRSASLALQVRQRGLFSHSESAIRVEMQVLQYTWPQTATTASSGMSPQTGHSWLPSAAARSSDSRSSGARAAAAASSSGPGGCALASPMLARPPFTSSGWLQAWRRRSSMSRMLT
mmetsp:Transcript_18070/g.47148  ORF Transcript_18070/g.47148 Transcript_18070/m.47148 type:complete len:209 (-) Transcript_18070:332-958(-)